MVRLRLILIGVVALIFVASEALFMVHQTQSAIVLQFGKIVKKHQSPGLKIKIPFVQNVIFFNNRLLHFNVPALEVNAADQKRLVVDLFVRYKITDILSFYQTIGSDIRSIENRISGIVLDIMQEVIARFPLSDMLSEKRSAIMEEIHGKVLEAAKGFGIKVHDVRIIRADLPKENSEAIFDRMESERRQEAKQFRAEGAELGKGITAQADRDRIVILSEAKRQASVLLGEGESISAKLYADAYKLDKKFFEIYRSLQAYEKVITSKDTTMIIGTKDNKFLKHFSATSK